jgi:hypothetical protein
VRGGRGGAGRAQQGVAAAMQQLLRLSRTPVRGVLK